MARKRVEIVSLKMVRESSVYYDARRINSPNDLYDLLAEFLVDSDKEKLMVVCLNTKNEPVNITTVSIGTLKESLAVPREILKTAILSNSAKIMLAHNHPSGDTTPSKEDWRTTERLAQAGKIVGVELLDHIIIGGSSYTSLRVMDSDVFK